MCHLHNTSPAAVHTGHPVSRRTLLAGAGAALAAGLALPSVAQAVPQPRSRIWAIVGATVFDGNRTLPDATVLIRGDRILMVGRRAECVLPQKTDVIDGRGKFVIPGLIEAHEHLGATIEEKVTNLPRMLGFGYTSIFDPYGSLDGFAVLKELASAPDAPTPRYVSTGPLLCNPGGFGDAGVPETKVITDPDKAFEVVGQLAEAGVDAIKAANDDFFWGRASAVPMPVATQKAIVAAARRHGLKVFFHAPAKRLATQALEAGAAGLLHGILDEPVDREFLSLIDRTGASYVSTFMIFDVIGDIVDIVNRQQAYDRRGLLSAATYDALRSPEVVALIEGGFETAKVGSLLPTLRANAVSVSRSGANVTFGSDHGPFGVAVGVGSQFELVQHGEAGLSPRQVIRGATLGGARMLGLHDRGTLAPGKLADLVILTANPLADLTNLHFVDQVVKGGRLFGT